MPTVRRCPGSQEFEARIAALDCSLFDLVASQSTVKDRRSWLALQRAVREGQDKYVYLEIGSYLGGSLQQYFQDPACVRIFSIDKRTRDERHRDNSEEAMLANLRRVAPDQLPKLVCFESDARELPPGVIDSAPRSLLHRRQAHLRGSAQRLRLLPAHLRPTCCDLLP